MSGADCHFRFPTSGTTKNLSFNWETVNGQQTCALCQQYVYVRKDTVINSSVGFVCLDCSHPIHNEIRHSERRGYVWVRGGPLNLFWKLVFSTYTTHYHLCENSICLHRISKEHTCCSDKCAEAKEEEDRTRAEQARINSWNDACSSQSSYGTRRG